jgi:hypothetical protein
MKKLLLLLALIFFASAGCKEKKQADYTVLGVYTPYQGYMEKLNGKVETVTETNFWAIPEGETFVKGRKMTSKELDSLNYTGDFTAKFDETGNIISCTWYDENKKMLSKWEITRKDDMTGKADYTFKDTVRFYDKLKFDSKGDIIELEEYNAKADTLLQKTTGEKSMNGDTITYINYNNKNELRNKGLFIYNDKGLFQGYQVYDKDGNYRGGDELTYDDKGDISGIKFFDKDKKVTAENTFINNLDAKGNPVISICKDATGFVIITERVYSYFE